MQLEEISAVSNTVQSLVIAADGFHAVLLKRMEQYGWKGDLKNAFSNISFLLLYSKKSNPNIRPTLPHS